MSGVAASFVSCSVRRPERCQAFKVSTGTAAMPAGWRDVDVPGFGLFVFCPDHSAVADQAEVAARDERGRREFREVCRLLRAERSA